MPSIWNCCPCPGRELAQDYAGGTLPGWDFGTIPKKMGRMTVRFGDTLRAHAAVAGAVVNNDRLVVQFPAPYCRLLRNICRSTINFHVLLDPSQEWHSFNVHQCSFTWHIACISYAEWSAWQPGRDIHEPECRGCCRQQQCGTSSSW